MPIYEYQCKKCGTIEEALQKFSDKPLTKCRHCSGKLHKLVSRSSFHLKGTGWYVTDYANGPAIRIPLPKTKRRARMPASQIKQHRPTKTSRRPLKKNPRKQRSRQRQKTLKTTLYKHKCVLTLV